MEKNYLSHAKRGQKSAEAQWCEANPASGFLPR